MLRTDLAEAPPGMQRRPTQTKSSWRSDDRCCREAFTRDVPAIERVGYEYLLSKLLNDAIKKLRCVASLAMIGN